MGIEDNEMINSAMDAAEVQITEKSENDVLAQEVANEVLQESKVSKASKARDASGKFTKSESNEAAETIQQEPEQVSSQEAKDINQEVESQEAQANSEPSIEVNNFWPAALKDAVSKGSKEDVVRHFAQYDQQRNEWAYGKEREAAKYKAKDDRWNEVVTPEVRSKLTLYGCRDEYEGMQRMLAWNDVVENDPMAAIFKLMEHNTYTLADLQNAYEGNSYQPEIQNDPRLAEIEARAKAAEERIQAFEQNVQTEKLLNEVNAFKQGKDEFGNVRSKFCETYAAQIDGRAQAIKEQAMAAGYNPSLTEVLDAAYKAVYKEISDFHGIKPNASKPVDTQAVIANAKKAEAAASKASGVPVSGQPSQRGRLRGKTFDDRLKEAVNLSLDQHGL